MTCIDLMSKHSKLQKWSKYKDLHRFHVKPIKTTQNYKSDQITMYCIELTSKRSKMLRFVAKHSKQQQNYKSNQITMICIDLTSKRSKILSYVAKHSKQRKTTESDQITMNCIDLTSKDKKCWITSQTFKTTQNYKSDQITMTCIDLTSKDKKCRVKSPNIQNNAKLQKWSYYDEFPSIWRQNDKNVELRRKTFKTTLNYKSIKTMTCIDLMSKTSKQRETTKRSNYNELHRFDVITIKNVELRRKTFKTTQNYKSNQITMNLHRFDVKTIKTTQNYKTIKLQWIASIWRHNDQKCWVTSQNIQNNAKLQKWSYNDEFASISCQNDQNNSKLQKRSNYNELHRFDVITIKMLSYVAMHSKQHKTTKVIKLQWLASISCQKHQNNEKLQTRSNYNELHRFDVITIKNVELRRNAFKTTQNYKSDHITMNLHRFHVKTIKTTQNYKNDQITMNCIDLTS